MKLNPYLSFKDNAREAMEFYQSVFGGDLEVSTFGEYPESGYDPSESDKVMHSQLDAPNGLTLMASDTPSSMEYREPQGISVSLSGDDANEITAAWEKLSQGAKVTMPLGEPPWGGLFGMLTDRFGVDWFLAANA